MSCIITYKGKKYSEEQFKEYFISNKQEFATPIAKNKDVIDSFKRKMEGIDYVFSQSPELASIGSKAQYLQYLSTIFPNSKVKDIVYHGTNAEFENFSRDIEYFKLDKNINRPFYFTTSKTFWNRKNRKTAILNIPSIVNRQTFENNSEFKELFNKIIKEEGSLHGITTYDKFLSEVDRKSPYPFENPKVGEYLRKNNLTFETPEGGQTYTVFEPEQIHVLGSKLDLEMFKNFINKDKKNNNQELEW